MLFFKHSIYVKKNMISAKKYESNLALPIKE